MEIFFNEQELDGKKIPQETKYLCDLLCKVTMTGGGKRHPVKMQHNLPQYFYLLLTLVFQNK